MRDQHSPLRLLVFTLASVVTLLVFSLASYLTTPAVSGQDTDPIAEVTEAPPVDATAEADPGPREIEHALDTTVIEGTPARVVALEWTYAEDLIAVGLGCLVVEARVPDLAFENVAVRFDEDGRALGIAFLNGRFTALALHRGSCCLNYRRQAVRELPLNKE